VLDNLIGKQRYQDIIIKLREENRGNNSKLSSLFVRKQVLDGEGGELTHLSRTKMLADIEHFPSVLDRITPENITAFAMERMKQLVREEAYEASRDLSETINKIDMLQ